MFPKYEMKKRGPKEFIIQLEHWKVSITFINIQQRGFSTWEHTAEKLNKKLWLEWAATARLAFPLSEAPQASLQCSQASGQGCPTWQQLFVA